MAESIYLVGAEDVRRAASTMSSAADEMQRAANIISESNDMFIRRFEELVCRLEQITVMEQRNQEPDRLMRVKDVLKVVNHSAQTLGKWVVEGRFPDSIDLNGVSVWKESTVNAWIESLPHTDS